MIKKANILAAVISSFFTLGTFGYDFYSHVLLFEFNEQQIDNSYKIFELLILPRYGLLSFIYEIITRIGIPLGYAAFLLIYIPIKEIIKAQIPNINRIQTKNIFLLIFLCYLSTYYSALTLVSLYTIGYLVSNKKLLLAGLFFHPVGIFMIIPSILLFFSNKKQKFQIIKASIFFFSISFIFQKIGFFNSITENIRFHLRWSSFKDILIYSFSNKLPQIIIIGVMAFSLKYWYFVKKPFHFKGSKFKANFSSILILTFILHGAINFQICLNDKNNVYTSFFEKYELVKLAWIELGPRETKQSFYSLDYERWRNR